MLPTGSFFVPIPGVSGNWILSDAVLGTCTALGAGLRAVGLAYVVKNWKDVPSYAFL
jgi:hypothetical protein